MFNYAQGIQCSGDLLISVMDDNGKFGGFLPAVNATLFKVSADGADIKQRVSKMRATSGQILSQTSVAKPHKVEIEVDGFSGPVLAMVFSGSVATINEAPAAITAKPLTFDADNWMPIGARNLTAVTVTASNGTTPRVLGTDYALNTRLGLIRALPGGACVNGDLINATPKAVTGTVVKGATKSQVDVKIILDGINKDGGGDVIVTIDHSTLNSTDGIDFLSSDFAGAKLSGNPVTLPGKLWPYTVEFPEYAV